jgi:tRNA-specific 2-thiouridylase
VALLRRLAPEALTPGDIVDSGGAVIGKHEGYAKYTIGQRRGVGVAAGVPIYVTEIDPDTAQVTVGPKDEVLSRRLWAKRATWAAETPERFEATVQIRYNHRGELALVTRSGEGFRAEFAAPVPAVTPGQAAVVYDGERVLGGGWIVSGG